MMPDQTEPLDATESLEARFLAKLSLLCSRCSFNRDTRSFWYSAASCFAFTARFFFSATLRRFLWRVMGVTNLWILGALLRFFPKQKKLSTTLSSSGTISIQNPIFSTRPNMLNQSTKKFKFGYYYYHIYNNPSFTLRKHVKHKLARYPRHLYYYKASMLRS